MVGEIMRKTLMDPNVLAQEGKWEHSEQVLLYI